MTPKGPAKERSRGPALSSKRRCQVFSIILLAFAFAAATPRLPGNPQETRRAETVAPGVERIEIRRGDFTGGGDPDRLTVNVLVLDPWKVRLSLGRANDRGVGTETPSSIAARRGALAAVNGGYFRTEGPYRGEPAGIVLIGGKLLSEPSRRRPGLAISNRGPKTRLAIVDVGFRAEVVTSRKARRRVDGVNRPRLDNELILFTPEFNRTTLTGPAGTEVTVAGGRVLSVADGRGDATIPAGGWVVSTHGASAVWVRENIQEGGRVDLRSDVRLSPRPGFSPEFVIGGGPRLVKAGRPAAATDPGIYPDGFAATRHPRTAAGVRADGRILLVTVDGRQPKKSVGMTIPELADLLLELGAVEAVNMDGGGSTAMVIRGRVVNSPSDITGERPVSDALLVFLR